MYPTCSQNKAIATPHRPSTPQNQPLHSEDSTGTPIHGSKFYEHDENEVPSYGENQEIMQSLENLALISTKEALALPRTSSASPEAARSLVSGSSPPLLGRSDSPSSHYGAPVGAKDEISMQSRNSVDEPKSGIKKGIAKIKGAFSRSKKPPVGRTDSKIDLLSQEEALAWSPPNRGKRKST